MKERQRLAVEYGIDAAAARGGWLAEEEALQVSVAAPHLRKQHAKTARPTPSSPRRTHKQVLEQEVVYLGKWLARQTNIAPGSPQQAFIGAMAACVHNCLYMSVPIHHARPSIELNRLILRPTPPAPPPAAAWAASGSGRPPSGAAGARARRRGGSAWRWRRWMATGWCTRHWSWRGRYVWVDDDWRAGRSGLSLTIRFMTTDHRRRPGTCWVSSSSGTGG